MLAAILLPGAADTVRGAESRWTIDLEMLQMELSGHDQHVLTIHETDQSGAVETHRIVTLDTESGAAFRGEVRYDRDLWSAGLDFSWFITSQSIPDSPLTASSEAGRQTRFEIADRSYLSTGPGEVLLYEVLEDTDVALWTVDLYALRKLAESGDASIRMQLGLRMGDFDNDYRAVVGREGTGGTRLDASSNYGLMKGPIVGLLGSFEKGKNRFDGYVGQSFLVGTAELKRFSRDFTGPLADAFPVDVELSREFQRDEFRAEQDVTIPVTDVRLRWARELSRRVSLGVGVQGSVWQDIPVPPGAVPGRGASALDENTLVLFGASVAVGLRF